MSAKSAHPCTLKRSRPSTSNRKAWTTRANRKAHRIWEKAWVAHGYDSDSEGPAPAVDHQADDAANKGRVFSFGALLEDDAFDTTMHQMQKVLLDAFAEWQDKTKDVEPYTCMIRAGMSLQEQLYLCKEAELVVRELRYDPMDLLGGLIECLEEMRAIDMSGHTCPSAERLTATIEAVEAAADLLRDVVKDEESENGSESDEGEEAGIESI